WRRAPGSCQNNMSPCTQYSNTSCPRVGVPIDTDLPSTPYTPAVSDSLSRRLEQRQALPTGLQLRIDVVKVEHTEAIFSALIVTPKVAFKQSRVSIISTRSERSRLSIATP